MSTLIESGSLLAGRYRLQELVSEAVPAAPLWKAIDEPLARPVAVRTLGSDFPRRREVIAAARAASKVADSRFAQVFDADESLQPAYVVREWIEGSRLDDLLRDGPLQPERAAGFIGEVAEALANAHAAGLTHRRLEPSCLMWAKGGALKITGLGLDAALHDISADVDGEHADARALGALLFTSLTGQWPDEGGRLSASPDWGERVSRPWDLYQAVPESLGRVALAALGYPEEPQHTLDTADAIRRELTGLPRPTASAPPEPAPIPGTDAVDAFHREEHPRREPSGKTGAPGRQTKGVLSVAAVLVVLVGVVLATWQVGQTLGDSTQEPGDKSPTATEETPSAKESSSPPVPTVVLEAVHIGGYDPLGDKLADDAEAPNAIDGRVSSVWTTETYEGNPKLGGMKDGVGLMLDMGDTVTIKKVELRLTGQGTSLELYVGNRPDRTHMRKVATARGVGHHAVLRLAEPVQARYLLVWLTKLPPVQGGYRAGVSEITVHGRAEVGT